MDTPCRTNCLYVANQIGESFSNLQSEYNITNYNEGHINCQTYTCKCILDNTVRLRFKIDECSDWGTVFLYTLAAFFLILGILYLAINLLTETKRYTIHSSFTI